MIKLDREFLNQVREHYQKAALLFDKDDKKYNECKDTFRGRLTGFLTPEYYQRKKLFLNGEINYGYVYRSFQTPEQQDYILTWVITSPEEYYLDHPEELSLISEALSNIDFSVKTKDKKLRTFINLLQQKYSEFRYLEIPAIYTANHLAFLSVVPFRLSHMASFRHGLNLIIQAKEISKEIFFLPDRYWPLEYKTEYYHLDFLNNDTKKL